MMVLERFLDHEDLGVFGKLFINGKFQCYTVEQPWNDNKPYKSCVPVGEYELIEYRSPKYSDTYALENPDLHVYAKQEDAHDKDRFACLLHSANWSHQLQGCIAFGQELSWGNHKDKDPALMVTNSRYTTGTVLRVIKNLHIDSLVIRWKHE
jgi:hypothetical protein